MSLNFNLASYYRVSTFFLIYSLCSAITTEHVLDVSYPIVIAEDGQASSKLSESHFGYTVSLARGKSTGEGKSSRDPDGWIFIGAPKASSSMYDSSSGEPTESGVIWRCSLGRSPNIGDSCEVVNIDPDPRPAKTRPNGPAVQSFDGAWIGGSMEINHGRLLTCGMRWNRGRSQFYNGICYWFSDYNGTKKSSYLSSDLSQLVNKRTYEQRLTPFFRSNRDQDRLFNFTLNNEVEQGHEWQISQAGVSTHLFTDKTLGSSLPNLLIGAPGVREWSGAVVLYTNNKDPRPELARPNRNLNDADAIFSEFVVGNRGLLPESGGFIRSYSHEYFGYSVSSGRYLSKDKVLYAGGAPRADHSGVVILFDFPPYQPPSSTYKRQIKSYLEIQAPGKSFASYFGSVLHSIDLDGNGLDELIVGAPLYTFSSGSSKDTARVEEVNLAGTERDKPKIGNFQEYGDHGCVFVYQFKSSEENEDIAKGSGRHSQILLGSKTPRARFGSAISSLEFNQKDVKGQKEIYLVIGAPYEISYTNDDSTSGAVYLYLFNRKAGKFGSFSQRIVASSISSSLNGFGSSLSISKDIDENSTPDMAIGSYKSGHSVVLRTRPKIELQSWMKFLSLEEKEIQEVRRGVEKFYVRSCFSVAEKLGLVALKLDIWVKVRFTDPSIKFHVDHINAIRENSANEVIYTRKVDAHTAESCQNLTVVSEHSRGIGMDDSDTLKEIKHPLHFIQEVWYNETLNRPLSVLNYSATGSQDPRRRNGELSFHSFDKRKPSPQVAKNTADLSISPTDCRDPVCRPSIETTWEFYNDNDEKISAFEVGSSKDIKLKIFLLNSGETAALPSLTLDWGITGIRESPSGSRWIHRMSCTDYSDSSRMTYTCPLGQYIIKGKNTTIEIQFAVKDIFVQQSKNFQFDVNGALSFADKHIEAFKSYGSIQAIVPQTMVKVTGSRENDTFRSPTRYMKSTNNKLLNEETSSGGRTTALYAAVRQRFTIEVKGASVKELVAKFKIPVMQSNVKSGKAEQLILVKLLHQNGKEMSCQTNSERSRFLMLDSVNSLDRSLSFTVHHKETKNFRTEIQPLPDPIQRRRRRNALNGNVTISNTVPEASSETPPEIAIDMKPLAPPVKQAKMEVGSDVLKLLCDNSEASCLEVTCTLQNVKANVHVHIPFELYLVKDAIDNILQSSGKNSLLIESTGSAYIFNAGRQHENSDVSQTAIVKISGGEVEAWWIVVAVLCGISLVALISVVLYKCGFFKREKRQQLNDMKAEHRRKSLIATARQSVMQAGSSADGGLSLEELTETEHRNEDKEPDEIQEDVKT